MPEAHNLICMLEEIMEDEKIGDSSNRKISQEEIKKMLLDRQKADAAEQDHAKTPLGEVLVREGLITAKQLQHALKLQAQKGGKIGSILFELGYISDANLLKFLGKQQGMQSTNLLDAVIDEGVMGILPFRTILKYRVLPLRVDGRLLSLAMENPNDLAAIHEVEFLTHKRVSPRIIPSYQMDLAIKYIEEKGGKFFSGSEVQQASRGLRALQAILEQLVSLKGTDLLITAGAPPAMKINTVLTRSNFPALTADQCVAYAKALMTERQWEELLNRKELDFGIDIDRLGRFRVNAYRQRNTISLAIRRIAATALGFDVLGLPRWIEQIVSKPQGLILVTAPTGHGKSTSLAAMIDLINRTRKCNIITLEDPIEYVFKPVQSNINQREVGADTASFSEGLRSIFRQAPDVIMIGEMRDQETFKIALRAASTGHLVMSTMHAAHATSAIDGMINRFPHHLQGDVRQQLSDALLLVFSQRLLPGKGVGSMVLAYEKLINSHRIKNFIRENKVHQIRTQIQMESNDFASLDVCLSRLLKEGKISMETALAFAENPDTLAGLRKES